MVRSGEHFPTDVLAGAALGAGVGIAVPLFHKRESDSRQSLDFLPVPEGGGLAWRVRL